jgi:hypothetical protein
MIPKVKKEYRQYLFYKCFKITLAAAIPVLLFSFRPFQIGFTIALFFAYPSDIPVI